MEHEKWALEAQYGRYLTDVTRQDHSALRESFEIEPGFRFKPNGEIKRRKGHEITNVAHYIQDWNEIKKDLESEQQAGKHVEQGFEEPLSNMFIPEEFDTAGRESGRPVKAADSFLCGVNVTKVIEESEQLLKDLNDLKDTLVKDKKYEHTPTTFLRAVSKDGQYSGGPDSVKSHAEKLKALELKDVKYESALKHRTKHEEKRFRSNCPACRFNLSVRKLSFAKDAEKAPAKKWQHFTGAHCMDSGDFFA